jgi:hypothetical protein
MSDVTRLAWPVEGALVAKAPTGDAEGRHQASTAGAVPWMSS